MENKSPANRQIRYLRRNYDTNVHEDNLTEERVYIRVEETFTGMIAEAIADYKLCTQWD